MLKVNLNFGVKGKQPIFYLVDRSWRKRQKMSQENGDVLNQVPGPNIVEKATAARHITKHFQTQQGSFLKHHQNHLTENWSF